MSKCNEDDLEHVQKLALRVILKDKYKDYKSALVLLRIESLYDRREALCLKFAKKGLKLAQFKHMFPVKKPKHLMEKRKTENFFVNIARTERYLNSSIPSMQRLLNRYERKFRDIIVTNEIHLCGSLVEKI